jgi:chromosome segregation ATPase
METNKKFTMRDQSQDRENSDCYIGIVAIASQIKSRATQLEQEDVMLQKAEHELSKAKKREAQENVLRRECRQKFLETSRQISAHEIHCMKIENDTTKQSIMNKKLRNQINEIEQQLNAEREIWGFQQNDMTEDIPSNNENESIAILSQTRAGNILYEKFLAQAIHTVERRKLSREHKLKSSSFIRKCYEQKIGDLREEMIHLEEEILKFQETELQTNQKVEVAADQVRLALTKVRTS